MDESVVFYQNRWLIIRGLLSAMALLIFCSAAIWWIVVLLEDPHVSKAGSLKVFLGLCALLAAFAVFLGWGILKHLLFLTPMVEVSQQGLSLRGLGLIPWDDILNAEIEDFVDMKGQSTALLMFEVRNLPVYLSKMSAMIKFLAAPNGGRDNMWYLPQRSLATPLYNVRDTVNPTFPK